MTALTPKHRPAARFAALLLVLASAGCGERPAGEPSAQPPAGQQERASPAPADGPAATEDPIDAGALRRVDAETFEYADVDGRLVEGYFAYPADMIEPLPAVMLIHDWWGLDEQMRERAETLAGQGYIVLAVDLYGGKTADTPAEARVLMLELLDAQQAGEDNLLQAHRFLSESAGAPSVGALGWGLGGLWALKSAILLPEELEAAVIYYGQVIADDERLAPLQVPILAFYGGKDTVVRTPSVETFRSVLEALGKEHRIEIYPEAGRHFDHPAHPNYRPGATQDAWEKTLGFLRDHLDST